MFRFTRPLLNAAQRKTTTGITGLKVHHDPLPALTEAYEHTLSALKSVPETSIYRQGVEALTLNKLRILKEAQGDVTKVEKELGEGHIEESLDIAKDELALVSKMIEWKA